MHEDATLTVATYQSLNSAMKRGAEHGLKDETYLAVRKLLGETEGILVDECHTLPAESFYRIAMTTKRAYYRVGLSGTPLARGDKKSMFAIAAIGPVVYRVRPQLLIDRGVLAKPTVRMVTCNQHAGGVTWTGVYGANIVRSTKRNATVLGMVKRATKPSFVFVQQVEHGKALAKTLTNAGMNAEFVWGSHSLDYRKSLIRRLIAGHFDALVCSSVFHEGIDVPELRSVVVASGMKSVIATLQRLGRGMRVDRDAAGVTREGGEKFEVWDVLDTGNQWTEKHGRARQMAYAGEGYELFVEPEPIAAQAQSTRRRARV
jgi:superfamily II DNA or RNA helicase